MSNETIEKTAQTALEILRSEPVESKIHFHNIEYHFEAIKDMPPAERFAVNNFLVGYLSGIVTREQWERAHEYALMSAKRSLGRSL